MRDDSVSIAKGIAIILMVMAHARCPLWLQHYINMFHMPLFFFFSGYCFKATYLDNTKGFILKRIEGIYLPYVKWSLLFLLCHNLFFNLNIYNDEYGFRDMASNLYTLNEFAARCINILTRMQGHEQLLGGYWFMKSMFFGSFIFFATVYVFNKNRIWGGVFLAAIMLVFLLIKKNIPYFGIGAREILAAFFIYVGYVYKEMKLALETYHFWLVIPICAVFVAIGTEFWYCSMVMFSSNLVLPYIFSACAGILMVFATSRLIVRSKTLRNLMVYIGDNTLTILTWHFLSFKLVSLLLICSISLPFERLAEFPVIESLAYQGWWIAYLLIGVAIPLIWVFSITRFCFFHG